MLRAYAYLRRTVVTFSSPWGLEASPCQWLHQNFFARHKMGNDLVEVEVGILFYHSKAGVEITGTLL